MFTLPATGDLTLHGVTRTVTIDLNAKVTGNRVIVQGSAPVKMADHRIDPPNIVSFGSVADEGRLEFLVSLSRG